MCPEAVIQYLDTYWEDIEPFEIPATIKSNNVSLLNVWACWRDDQGNFHALDYTDDNIAVYIFKGAYPIKYEDDYESMDCDQIVLKDLKINCTPFVFDLVKR